MTSQAQESTVLTNPTLTPRYKLLPSVRKQLLQEFTFTKNCQEFLENKLGQEPYNMITNRNGQKVPSTRWTIMLEQLWKINNREESFIDKMTYETHSFNRRSIYNEPAFKSNLISHLRTQFDDLGYNRVFINDVTRSQWVGNERQEFKTYQLKIPV